MYPCLYLIHNSSFDPSSNSSFDPSPNFDPSPEGGISTAPEIFINPFTMALYTVKAR